MYLYKYAGHDISVTNPFLEYLIDKDGQKKKEVQWLSLNCGNHEYEN